jgi:hypothetical protein
MQALVRASVSNSATRTQYKMDAEGFAIKVDRTGCRHSYEEGSFFRIGGMQAAKCFTCDRTIAWPIETAGKRNRLTWIA